MAFQIIEIKDAQPGNTLAKVSHGGNQIEVTIRHQSDGLTAGQFIQAEIDYDELIEWNVIDDFSEDKSGIWQKDDGIHLAGRIHNVLDYGNGKTIVDVYMQQGPEFFSVTAETMEEIEFDADAGLKIVVKTLYLHPAL